MSAHGVLSACHDISDGGLLPALAEMTLKAGIGAEITLPEGVEAIAYCFGEDQGRYLIAVPQGKRDQLLLAANELDLPLTDLGKTGGDMLIVAGYTRVPVTHLKEVHHAWMPGYME